jgi:hypothetical protein
MMHDVFNRHWSGPADYCEWANETYDDPWLPKWKQGRRRKRRRNKGRKRFIGGRMRIRKFR